VQLFDLAINLGRLAQVSRVQIQHVHGYFDTETDHARFGDVFVDPPQDRLQRHFVAAPECRAECRPVTEGRQEG